MAIIEQSIDINVPAHAAYEQLMHFEQYPRFMEGVEEVRRLDATHLHWRARMGARDTEWDAEITEQVPDRCIAWRSVGGVRNEGRVQLLQVEADLTRVTLTMNNELEVQASGQPGTDEAAEMEDVLARRAQQDLARFKKFAESAHGGSGEWRDTVHHAGEREFASAAARGRREGAHASDAYVEQRSGSDRRRREPMRLPNLLQAWSDPVSAMRKVSDEVDQFAQKFIGRPAFGVRAHHGATGTAGTGAAADWTPAVEVARRDNRFVVCAELPGVRREDVQIEIRSGKLTIQGERRPRQAEQATPQFRRSERAYGHFHRVIALPDGADDDAASASMQDGVLEVTVPVVADIRPGRRIEIQGA
jgi:HSP20 family molecular chaperone IbpA